MSTKNKQDGSQPAFPCPEGHVEGYDLTGMTLRQYFAIQVLPAIIAGTGNFEGRQNFEDNADLAIYQADALIAALEKNK